MADIPSNIPGAPQGAEPMKKSTGKVQPKKETVRINLPPKPSAAPTIKLPTLPPGGPTGAGSVTPGHAPAPAHAAPVAAPAPRASAAAPVAQRQTTPAPQRPVAAPAAAPTLSKVDKILAIAAAVAGLVAVGSVLYLSFV